MLFLNFCHAAASFLTISISSILLFRHWPVSTFNSISAIFQPASVLRGIHKLKPVPQRLCLIWRKRFIKRSRVVRVQVIHHQRYLFCTFVLTGDLFYKTSPFQLGFSFCDFDHAFSCQWLTGKENIAYAATPVFIVVFGHLPW